MKHKYQIAIADNERLVIREYAELDKESFSLLCEEVYERSAVERTMKEGADALVAFLRTKNMYPPGIYANKIASTVLEMASCDGESTRELVFDDVDLLSQVRVPAAELEDIEDEDAELDDLLGDELDDEYDEKNDMKNVKSSIQISDDTSMDLEEDA
jgi:hypothetical protein